MKLVFNRGTSFPRIAVLAAVVVTLGWADQARAQWSTKWLTAGELHSPFLSGGSEPENIPTIADRVMLWPGIRPQASYNHWKGMWISAKNYTDETGQQYPVRISHIGPRFLGIGEVFTVQHDLVGRFEAPVAMVDGLETFSKPVVLDDVDPSMKADRAIINVINSSVGVTMERRVLQFSNEHHDDYYITEYTFTNTGNVDDDEDVELPDQQLDDVYFTFFRRPKINAPAGSWDNSGGGNAWGQFTMNDAVGDGHEDYGVDFRAQFAWMGHVSGQDRYSTIGSPMWFPGSWWYTLQEDTVGRLGGAAMVGTLILHADAQAHAPGASAPDDPDQPRVMTFLDSDDAELTGANDHNNIAQMQFERNWIEQGAPFRNYGIGGEGPRTWPHHAYTVKPDGDFANQRSDPSHGRPGGWGYVNGFGPYDMAPGEQVRIVVAEGVAGLDQELAYQMGRWHKRNGADEEALYAWNPRTGQPCTVGSSADCLAMKKNDWVMTSRDSLFKMFEKAERLYESGYNLPEPPMPPRTFEVVSGTNKITLTWTPFDGGPARTGWELYRAQNRYDGIPAPDEKTKYRLVQTFGADATSYEDTDVDRGVSYFYYLVAVGQPQPVDPLAITGTPGGTPLRSSRYYAQTYEPAFLRRPPGATLEAARIVPNPYIIEADSELRWPDQQDKLGFLDIPGNCTIEIYTELGELVESIEHTNGSGDEFWNLTTSSQQVVASGVYIAVITDRDTGEQLIRKFVVIR